jgi:hypothetical protein
MDQTLLWDARIGDKPVLPGVYIWSAQVKKLDGNLEWISGDVTVLR